MTRTPDAMLSVKTPAGEVTTTRSLSPAETVTLSLLVADVHGALDRVFGLARRQGCAVRTLVLVPSGTPDVSSLTLTVSGGNPERLLQQLSRVVSVVSATAVRD